MAFESRSRRMPGPFKVCLPGTVSINENDLLAISGLYPTGSEDGSYIVEFTDQQMAQHYQNQAHRARHEEELRLAHTAARNSFTAPGKGQKARSPDASGVLPGPPGVLGPDPSKMPMPFQKSSRVQKSKTATASPSGRNSNLTDFPAPAQKSPAQTSMPAQTGHEVMVSGLPNHLMKESMLSAVLDQGRLEKEVLGFNLIPPNMARIYVSSETAAETCAAHFHGRSWNAQGTRVTAKIVGCSPENMGQKQQQSKTQGKRGKNTTDQRVPQPPQAMPNYAKGPKGSVPPSFHGYRGVGTSDASTTVSEEDPHDQDWWAGSLDWRISPGQTSTMCF